MKISVTPSMPLLQHVVLNPEETYQMGDYCVLREWKIADKGMAAHLLIQHGEEHHCTCPSRHHEFVPPPPHAR